MSRPTIREILAKTEDYFRAKAVDSPRLSAQLILAKGLEMDRMGLFLDLDRPLREDELAQVRPLVARRGQGEPVAYILGNKEFFGLEFTVTPDVLIPRPETELIVEQAQAALAQDQAFNFADLGTGSGCLAVTLAKVFPVSRGTALDQSPQALAVARENAGRHGVAERIEFIQALFPDLPEVDGGYRLVVANPPYVSQAEYDGLSREVAGFEPKGALVPGQTGLEAFPAVAQAASRTLAPGGLLLMEMGWEQAEAVTGLLRSPEYDFAEVAVLKDLAGLNRLVSARRAGS
jgi:release factor glutamine methyltransferase